MNMYISENTNCDYHICLRLYEETELTKLEEHKNKINEINKIGSV